MPALCLVTKDTTVRDQGWEAVGASVRKLGKPTVEEALEAGTQGSGRQKLVSRSIERDWYRMGEDAVLIANGTEEQLIKACQTTDTDLVGVKVGPATDRLQFKFYFSRQRNLLTRTVTLTLLVAGTTYWGGKTPPDDQTPGVVPFQEYTDYADPDALFLGIADEGDEPTGYLVAIVRELTEYGKHEKD